MNYAQIQKTLRLSPSLWKTVNAIIKKDANPTGPALIAVPVVQNHQNILEKQYKHKARQSVLKNGLLRNRVT